MNSAQAKNQWEKVKSPIKAKKVQSVGTYTNGCVLGAKALPLKGQGYQVIRASRRRYFGHPNLTHYIQRLGKKIKANGLPDLLVADMGMPAGGPFRKGHRSHQTGLDADIWLRPGPSNRSYPKPLNVVNFKRFYTNGNWTKNHEKILKLAAADKNVQRIFVNAAIKRKLCESSGNKSWLRKIRPWGGHNYHFHVRLKCPAGNSNCRPQNNVGWGSGCGKDVMRWDPRKWKKPDKNAVKKKKKPRKKRILPNMCRQAIR